MVWNVRATDGIGGVVFMSSPKGLSITVERQGLTMVSDIPRPLVPNLTRFLMESGAKFGKVWSAQDDGQLPPAP
jgi:hypothetical protein